MAVFEISRQVRRRLDLAEELPSDHPEGLDRAAAAIAALPDPELMCAEERAGSLAAAATLRNSLEAYMARLAGSADAHADGRVLGAGTTGMLVAVATGQNPQAGSALVARGAALTGVPRVAASFTEGRVSAAHVAAIVSEWPRIAHFADIEEHVVAIAEAVEPTELRRLLKLLADQSRPESRDEDHADQRERRGVSLSETPNGMFRLDGYLDALQGSRLRDALAALMDRGGREDRRTAKQRRADALADLTAAAAANRSPLGVSQVSVLVDLEDLAAGDGVTLEDGSALGVRMADLVTCMSIIHVILGTRRKGLFVPLALARGKRVASSSQWRALVARDRGCIRCGRSPGFCEAHHVHHWRHGGSTDVDNLVLLCSRCHHDLHLGLYVIEMDEGIPRIRRTVSRGPPLTG